MAYYLVLEGASDEELKGLVASEYGPRGLQLGAGHNRLFGQALSTMGQRLADLRKKIFARKGKPKKPTGVPEVNPLASRETKVPDALETKAPVSRVSPDSAGSNFVRRGPMGFLSSGGVNEVRSSYELMSVKTPWNEDIPLRAVEKFTDIPIGSGEFVTVTMTRRQWAELQRARASDPLRSSWLKVEEKSSSANSNIVTLKISDNSVRGVLSFLNQQDGGRPRPLMFDLENSAHIGRWDTVKKDLQQSTQDLEQTIRNGTLLGKGAFGKAYKITRPDGTEYVLKRMSASKQSNLKEIALLTEGSCRDCLQYYGAVKHGDDLYLASEVAARGELAKRVGKEPITNREIISLLEQGQQLVDRGLINTDLKLENVLVTADGGVKIMDFGIAQKNPTRFNIAGSPHTMAPEVRKRERVSPDLRGRPMVYSLAMSILDGKSHRAFDAYFNAIVRKNINLQGPKNSTYFESNPNFTRAEIDLLGKMLEQNPANRISMADALREWKVLAGLTDQP